VRRAGAEAARRRYNVSFVLFSFAMWGKYRRKNGLKMGGEGRRKGGNDPVRWPPSVQGSWNRRREMDQSTMRLGGLQPHTQLTAVGLTQ
jgi:hypothetical protein